MNVMKGITGSLMGKVTGRGKTCDAVLLLLHDGSDRTFNYRFDSVTKVSTPGRPLDVQQTAHTFIIQSERDDRGSASAVSASWAVHYLLSARHK